MPHTYNRPLTRNASVVFTHSENTESPSQVKDKMLKDIISLLFLLKTAPSPKSELQQDRPKGEGEGASLFLRLLTFASFLPWRIKTSPGWKWYHTPLWAATDSEKNWEETWEGEKPRYAWTGWYAQKFKHLMADHYMSDLFEKSHTRIVGCYKTRQDSIAFRLCLKNPLKPWHYSSLYLCVCVCVYAMRMERKERKRKN